MGADQALYAYVGERILAGALPYRDAWDQKPPAMHFTYAGPGGLARTRPACRPRTSSSLPRSAALLVAFGRRSGATGIGQASAIIFLLLSNPAFARLGGVRVRAQCETFIALAITAALVSIARSRDKGAAWRLIVAGLCLGIAFVFKYNTAAYGAGGGRGAGDLESPHDPGAGADRRRRARTVAALLVVFARGGALPDLYQATITYNLRYSGETYGGALAPLAYLVTFPVRHASVDGSGWWGALGCALLLVAGLWKRERWLPVAWVAAACLVDHDQRQPRPAAVFHPGGAGAGAGRGLRAAACVARHRALNLLLIVIAGSASGA